MPDEFSIDFIGIGAHKAATSWIFCCLKEHPDIFVYPGKETHFFKHDDLFVQGKKYYANFFSGSFGKKIVGEFSTSYLADERIPQRIKDFFPEVKIIVCLRNPLDRFEAQMIHLISKRRLDRNLSLSEAIKKCPSLIENGLYGKYLSYYYKLFGSQQIHVILFDDIKNKPSHVIRELYVFLGVDNNFVPKVTEQTYHSDAVVSSYFYRKSNRIYFYLKDKKIGKVFIRILKFFGLNSYVLHSLVHFLKKKNVDVYKLKNEERNFLISVYRDDLKLLGQIISRDLIYWLKSYEDNTV